MLSRLGQKVVPLHSDEKLVERAKLGDRHAFDEIVGRYKNPLFRYLIRLSGNAATAEDLTQDTFLKAYRAMDRLSRADRLKPWLYAIATNTAHSHRAHFGRLKQQEPPPQDATALETWIDQLEDPNSAVEKLADAEKLKEMVKTAVAALPSPYKEVVVLRDMEEMNYEDIALALGLNLGTVKSRLARGRVMLQEKLLEAGL